MRPAVAMSGHAITEEGDSSLFQWRPGNGPHVDMFNATGAELFGQLVDRTARSNDVVDESNMMRWFL